MTKRILEIQFDDNDIGMQKLAAKIAIALRDEFGTKFGAVNRVILTDVNPNKVEQRAQVIPFYGNLRGHSRINNAIRQLSGIANPHVGGPDGGGAA